MSRTPFAPRDGATVTIAASTSSADEAISTGQHQLHIHNASASVAHVKVGQGTSLTATTADFPVGTGESKIITIGSSANIVAVILASGIGNVYVTPGTGG